MTSIQLSKAQLQKQLEQANQRDIYAINIATTSQKTEVMRAMEAALRDKRQVSICIIKQ